MVHVFIPALFAIYLPNIWMSLSLIYIFESVEFIFSELPGSEYWAEDSNVDTLVSDILMGLLGFWAVSDFKSGIPESACWYAYLQPITTSPQWYQKWSGFIHVLMAAIPILGIAVGGYSEIEIPIFYQYAIFGVPYIIVALLFGHSEWALFSGLCISLISLLAIMYGHTIIVSTGVVVFFALIFRKTPPLISKPTPPLISKPTPPLISKLTF